ncbi:cell division topological specificity factor MinE [Tindallia magadiensis]
MMDFFKFFTGESKKSKNVAKERLKLVLVHDRADCSQDFLNEIKEDLINVISDYMVIDEEELDIKITRTKRESDEATMPALVANIPIKHMKDRKR